jgi:hypothetical protein
MGVKVVVGEHEPIGLALRRFKVLLSQHRASWKPYKPLGWWRPIYFVKPTQMRRYKKFRKKIKARLATLRAKRAGEQ